MALQHTYTDPATEHTADNAYTRINDFDVRFVGAETGTLIVDTYRSAGAASRGRAPIARRRFDVDKAAYRTILDINAGVTVEQYSNRVLNRAYDYLKTLPDFAGAVDV